MALAFPDLYEIGMSYLGIQILYHIVNARKDVAAERVFAPAPDVETALRAAGLPLCSLESRTPLAHFDIVGFSLLYELNFTNILNMLSLSEIPLFASDRSDKDPMVVAGGPCTFNPEPLAEFFDAMVIGDGEEVILGLLDSWLEWREAGGDRDGLLRRWARIQGVYVPSLFEARWDESRAQILLPKVSGYETVRKAVVRDLNQVPYPDCPVVPFGKPIHDRLSLEICRGCTRGCRFCQAGMIYRPVRERAPETVLALAQRALRCTGYEDVSLLSLSTGDYGALQALTERLMAKCEPEKVAVSLPSLRVGSLTASLMAQIKRVRKTGFTLAPEAGSSRLRDVINKNVTEDALREDVEKAFSLGWQLVKLYFMIGLPTETNEDVDAIVELVGRLKKIRIPGRGKKEINVSVSTFVPKAHTPFQWAPQISLSESEEKIRTLRDRITGAGLRFKWQSPRMSILEGIWARGDRRLSRLLVKAFELGCRFDGWSDQLQFDTWKKAMEEAEVDLDTYTRGRDLWAPLPWDHVDAGVTKAFLRQERERSLVGTSVADCRQGGCHQCGVCDFETIQPITFDAEITDEGVPRRSRLSENPLFERVRVSYAKTGPARFLGHLEMVKVITRAFRRAQISLRFSEGFHPAPKMSFAPPLPVGIESTEEYVYVEVLGHVQPKVVVQRLNEQLPEGLRVTGCVPMFGACVQPESKVFDFTICLKEGTFAEGPVEEFAKRRSWPIKRTNKKGRNKEIDLKLVVTELALVSSTMLRMRLDYTSGQHVRAEEVVEALFCLPERSRKLATILKEPARLSCPPGAK
jgi:radical SAM family uncharacterized protein/radical SAM-linked protein